MIHYLKGNAADPRDHSPCVIAHIVNDIGRWGAGFTRSLDDNDTYPGQSYLDTFQTGELQLGTVWFCSYKVEKRGQPLRHYSVANMCAQHGVGRANKPIRYDALEKCLVSVAAHLKIMKVPVCMPRIGTGLAGGSWGVIEPMIEKTLGEHQVYVYDL